MAENKMGRPKVRKGYEASCPACREELRYNNRQGCDQHKRLYPLPTRYTHYSSGIFPTSHAAAKSSGATRPVPAD